MSKLNHIGISGRPTLSGYNFGRPDGIGVYTKYIINGVSANGIDVTKLLYQNHKTESDNKNYLKLPVSYEIGFINSLFNNKSLKVPFDVFHCTDYRLLRLSCPVVTTLYDAIPFVHPEYCSNKFRRIKNLILKRSAAYADRVIAISNYSQDEIVHHYNVEPTKISVIHLGVDEKWFQYVHTKNWEKTLRSRGLRPGYLLFVGLIQPRKNLMRILKAHSNLPQNIRKEFPIVIVGRFGWGMDHFKVQLDNKIALGEAVLLPDVTQFEELLHLFKGAGQLVFPSLYEGFGLPVLEAFASGLPVLTSSTSSLSEISGGVGVEVDPLDIDEITHAMSLLIHECKDSDRVSRGVLRAKEFSWDSTVSKTLELYRSLI